MTTPTLNLHDLCARTELPFHGTHNPTITAITLNSNTVKQGSIFVAIPGYATDGHTYIPQAIQNGAAAIVAERIIDHPDTIPYIVVPNARLWFGTLNAALYGEPSQQLTVVGITGTDGKTSTTTMLWSIWMHCGIPAALMTTVETRIKTESIANRNHTTTPEADVIQQQLHLMREAGCTHVALETSSHALALARVESVTYAGAVYTQVTSEHLDLHETREAYLEAKALLLEQTAAAKGFAVLNLDDTYAYPRLSSIPCTKVLTYSLNGNPSADLFASDILSTPTTLEATLHTPWGMERVAWKHLRGRFNVGNGMAALAASCLTGVVFGDAIDALAAIPIIEGRMEHIACGQSFNVVMDFAHTEQSLEVVLNELRPNTTGKLWVVFGSAGDRDVLKRAPMGRVAGTLADMVVVTDEDPRTEDPRALCEEIAAGAVAVGKERDVNLFVIPDRSAAIEYAISQVAAEDTLLVTGKGHEHAIDYATRAQPWNERKVLETAIRGRLAQLRG